MNGISKAARVGQMIIGVVYLVAGAIKVRGSRCFFIGRPFPMRRYSG